MRLKNASIKVKILYSSLIITILPLLLLELFFFVSIQKRIMRQYAASAQVSADRLQIRLINEVEKTEHMVQLLADFSPLSDYLESDFAKDAEQLGKYQDNIHPMLHSFSIAYPGIKIRIYHNYTSMRNFSFELCNDLADLLSLPQLKDKFVGREAFWQHTDLLYNTYRPVYSYFYTVRSQRWPHGISYIVTAHMDESVFLSDLRLYSEAADPIYVLDSEGNLLARNEAADEILELASPLLPDLENDTHINIAGKEFYVICRQDEHFSIVSLLPWNRFYRETFRSMLILLLSGILLLALSGFLSLRTSAYILRGIDDLAKKMQNVDRNRIQEMAVVSIDQNSQDEIVRLDAVFTKMMAQIDNLVTVVQEKEQHLKDEIIARQQAEICVLQHQINPHYLFNTLEAIRMNLILRDDRENAEIVRLFAESFRRYIDMRGEDTTLIEEIDFIRKYIRIQNYRLDGRIHFTCEMDGSLEGCHIKKLLLQPLVENAVCHGIEEKAEPGHITLCVLYSAGRLQITVTDDGIGMSQEHLQELRQRVFSSQYQTAVGLQNIWQRIHLTYGEQAEMSISSVYGEGTTVMIRIPFADRPG